MNRVVYPKEKELTVMAQKKKDSKMMGKIIKTAVSGVLCVALAGGMVAANVLIPPNASSVQSILGLKSGGIDNSKAKTEGINMEYSKPGFDTEAALVEDEIALNKKIAAEGIVLLKNDAGKMPYSTDTTFSFVSHSAVSYIGGNKVDMKTAFEDAGFGVNEALWKFYSEGNGKDYGLGVGSVSYGDDEDFSINECPLSVMKAEPGLTDSMKNTVPVFVFSRVAGEGRDMPRSMYNHTDVEEDKTKTYLEPDSTELEILQYLNDNFDDVVLLLNSSAAVDLSWVENYPSIHTVISAPAMGDYGLCSLAEIFSGKVNPSGRTVDTYEMDAMNSPAAQNFGDFAYYDEDGNLTKYNYVSYKEGIYVGYRYYETRYEDKVLGQGNAGDYNYADAVMYPFGYGLSYTTFTQKLDKVEETDGKLLATVTVTNTGDTAGKSRGGVGHLYFGKLLRLHCPGGTRKGLLFHLPESDDNDIIEEFRVFIKNDSKLSPAFNVHDFRRVADTGYLERCGLGYIQRERTVNVTYRAIGGVSDLDDTCTDEGLIGRVDNHALDFCLCQRIDCEEQRNDQEKYFLHLVIKVKKTMCV